MSHDNHFLSRLKRLPRPHVDTAMALYRDAELLRAVLAQSPLPDAAERIAISLADPVFGPFILVERNGHFVTCLAEGMRAVDLPVITRERFDHILEKVGVLRERFEAARKLVGGDNVAGRLLERLATAGLFLSREEFLAVSAVQPLMHQDMHETLSWALGTLDSYLELARGRRQAMRLDPKTLQTHWAIHGLVGHLAVLFAMDGRAFVKAKGLDAKELVTRFVVGPMLQGCLGMSMRGAWVAGKFGKIIFPLLKQSYIEARFPGRTKTDGATVLFAGMALLAIASRSDHYRAEIGKLLERIHPHASESQKRQLEFLRAYHRQVFSDVIIDDDARRRFQDFMGQSYLDAAAGLAMDSLWHFPSPGDVPRDLGFAALASSRRSTTTADAMLYLPVAAAGVARAEPQDLYFPNAVLAQITRPWRPEDSREVLAAQAAGLPPRVPIRVTAPPGRNEPCPCGSGQKYKRCCGRG